MKINFLFYIVILIKISTINANFNICPPNLYNASNFGSFSQGINKGGLIIITTTINNGNAGSETSTSLYTTPQGSSYSNTALTTLVQSQWIVAYEYIISLACNYYQSGIINTATIILPGVTCFTSQLTVSSSLTFSGNDSFILVSLNGPININFITITLINGASSCNIFYATNSTTTLGATTGYGIILSLGSITGGLIMTWNGKLFSNSTITLEALSTINNCQGITCSVVNTGRCCLKGYCNITTNSTCIANNGNYGGDFSLCSSTICLSGIYVSYCGQVFSNSTIELKFYYNNTNSFQTTISCNSGYNNFTNNCVQTQVFNQGYNFGFTIYSNLSKFYNWTIITGKL